MRVLLKVSLVPLLLWACAGTDAQSIRFGEVNVDDAVHRLDIGQADAPDLEVIASHQRKDAIPKLEGTFDGARDFALKSKAAEVLVRLGDGKPRFWKYLSDAAGDAVVADVPWPVLFDSRGQESGRTNPAFLRWVLEHKADPAAVKQDIAFLWPVAVLAVKDTGDSRAIPILRRGLQSPDYLIQAECIAGLGEFRDVASLPEALLAVKRAPSAFQSELAFGVQNFKDPQASAEVAKYLHPVQGTGASSSAQQKKRVAP